MADRSSEDADWAPTTTTSSTAGARTPAAFPDYETWEEIGKTEGCGELTTLAEILPKYPNVTLTALKMMPRVREAVPREQRNVKIDPKVNHEAVLAQTRGDLAPVPCANCRKGAGPFTNCVVVTGQLKGSCAGCHYNGKGHSCTFRPEKANAKSGKRKRDISESTSEISEVAEPSPGVIIEEEENFEPSTGESSVLDTTRTEKSRPSTEEVMKLGKMSSAGIVAAKEAIDLAMEKLVPEEVMRLLKMSSASMVAAKEAVDLAMEKLSGQP